MQFMKHVWGLSAYILLCQQCFNICYCNNTTLINESTNFELTNICNGNNTYDEHNFEHIDGQLIFTLVTNEPMPVEFLLKQVNSLFNYSATIGCRVIIINTTKSNLDDILLNEIEYHQQCINNSIGILITDPLWNDLKDLATDLEYNIWKLPSTGDLLFPKMIRMLQEIPWNDSNPIWSIEPVAKSFEILNQFLDITKLNKNCFSKFPSVPKSNSALILIGLEDKMEFEHNELILAIPLSTSDTKYIKDLPVGSFIIVESEIHLNTTKNNTIQGYRLSNFISLSSILINIVKSINETISSCAFHIMENSIFPDDCINRSVWNPQKKIYAPEEILKILNLEKSLKNFTTIELMQKLKLSTKTNFNYRSTFEYIASMNVTNEMITFHRQNDIKQNFGQLLKCNSTKWKDIHSVITVNNTYYYYEENSNNFQWQIKAEAWVAAGITISVLGILISLSILVFIISRIFMEDVLEGNPVGSIALLLSLILLFASFVPFSIEYVPYKDHTSVDSNQTLCSIRIFLITLCYCMTFSLLLCRALMLASIGSEGGFLSHVNGYIQSVLCLFSTLVQIGLSTQFMIIIHTTSASISCENIYYGNWIWALFAYDGFLLFFLVIVCPFIIRSQRNYKEGILITIASFLCLTVWTVWIPLSSFDDKWREAAIPLGVQCTGWAILVGLLIPRSFLIVRGIARSDLAQALPSLASLAFAHNNQYTSEQSIYECVNPAMRQRTSDDHFSDRCHSPSEIPTLPLRGASRKHHNPMCYANSAEQSTLPASPSKATRF